MICYCEIIYLCDDRCFQTNSYLTDHIISLWYEIRKGKTGRHLFTSRPVYAEGTLVLYDTSSSHLQPQYQREVLGILTITQ